MSDERETVAGEQPLILVIDDEDYVADMIASVLQLEGYATSVAYNGRDGLQQAQQFQGRLIIVDIMMPYLSGIELVNRIRERPESRPIPVVLISAGARPPTTMDGVTFLAKPFDIEQLLEHVHRLLM